MKVRYMAFIIALGILKTSLLCATDTPYEHREDVINTSPVYEDNQNTTNTHVYMKKETTLPEMFGCSFMWLAIPPAVYTMATKIPVWGLGWFASQACGTQDRIYQIHNDSNCSLPADYPCDPQTLSVVPSFCGVDRVGTISFYATVGLLGAGTLLLVADKTYSYFTKKEPPIIESLTSINTSINTSISIESSD